MQLEHDVGKKAKGEAKAGDAGGEAEEIKGDGKGGVQAVCFNESGDWLISVLRDNVHTLTIWEWRTHTKLYQQDMMQVRRAATATTTSTSTATTNTLTTLTTSTISPPVPPSDGAGRPPLVYGIKWNPVERPDLKGKYPDNKDCAFVTFGSKHLYFWSTNGSKDGRPINTELTGVGTCVLRDGEAIKG